jgi:hypothetical protein
VDDAAPERFLALYPEGIQAAAERLRGIVKVAVPDAVERVRTGWRLIGYEVPVGRRLRYFAYVAPESAHVHLGFEYGTWMKDADRMLHGAHLGLRKVRYVTFRPADTIPKAALIELTREAARVAAMTQAERMSIVLERDWQPDRSP